MPLNKIDIVFISHGDDPYLQEGKHFENFAKALQQVTHCQDFLIVREWKNIRYNSLLVVFEYEEFHDDIAEVAKHQANAHEFYRRIFLVNWDYSRSHDPDDYQNKSFAGNLTSRAYHVIIEKRKACIDYLDFYADDFALDTLRAGGIAPDWPWYVGELYTADGYLLTYWTVAANNSIIEVLAIFFDEYMEKYDDIKHLDKFAENPERPVLIEPLVDLPDEFVVDDFYAKIEKMSLPKKVESYDKLNVYMTMQVPFLRYTLVTVGPVKIQISHVPDDRYNHYIFFATETQHIKMQDGVTYIFEKDSRLYFTPKK